MRVPQSAQVARRLPERRDRQILGIACRRLLGCPAAETVEFAGLASLSQMLSPGMEKASKLAAQDEDRPPAVDPRQTGLQPAPHRVFMDPEQLRDLLHGVAPVDLYAPRIRPLHSANVRELSKTQNREIDRPHARMVIPHSPTPLSSDSTRDNGLVSCAGVHRDTWSLVLPRAG